MKKYPHPEEPAQRASRRTHIKLKLVAAFACIAALVTMVEAQGGHEVPVYPSYYPQEITIETVRREPAAALLRDRKIQAYLGPGWPGSGEPPAPLRAIESLGIFVPLTVNPASPLASDPNCAGI